MQKLRMIVYAAAFVMVTYGLVEGLSTPSGEGPFLRFLALATAATLLVLGAERFIRGSQPQRDQRISRSRGRSGSANRSRPGASSSGRESSTPAKSPDRSGATDSSDRSGGQQQGSSRSSSRGRGGGRRRPKRPASGDGRGGESANAGSGGSGQSAPDTGRSRNAGAGKPNDATKGVSLSDIVYPNRDDDRNR